MDKNVGSSPSAGLNAPTAESYALLRRVEPVSVLAVFGVVFLFYIVYVLAAWFTSPDFHTVMPPSNVPMPNYVKNAVLWTQIASTAFNIPLIWYWIIKPKWKTGNFSLLGLISIASATVYIHDPLQNYFSFGFSYNAALLNWGSWANFIPGFLTPNMQLWPENPFMAGSTYIWFNFGYPVMFVWLWRKLDQRFPRWSAVKVILALLGAMIVFDLIQEMIFLRFQVYGYPGAVQALSIFPGHYYQYPVYVGLTTAFFWFSMATLVYYRDDHGYSWAERGVNKLNLSRRVKTLVRFLALIGACHIIYIFSYFVPSWFWYSHSEGIPEDTPAYMINGVCGKEAGFPCHGSGVPFPRRGDTSDYPQWLHVDWEQVPYRFSRDPEAMDAPQSVAE